MTQLTKNQIETSSRISPFAVTCVHVFTIIAMAVPFFVFSTPQQGWSCAIAGAIVGLNLALIAWALKKIFQKKSVALTTLLIVIKYAVLLGILILLQRLGWRVNLGFVVGLAALFPTLAFITYKHLAVPL